MRVVGVAATALTIVLLPGAGLAHDPTQHAAPPKVEGPADAYVYELAPPGSYDLPRIKHAADARLLDETGSPQTLATLFDGRLTILAFIYTRCGDVCPLAGVRLADLQRLAAEDRRVAARLQLISLSFDLEHDTPAVMTDYAETWRAPEIDAPRWLFLTAAGRAEIAPLLAGYDQPVARKADPDSPGGPLSHLLRVFLIDDEGYIRNIYSADFLDARLLMNDVLTLQKDASR